jgi:hypothetical protein
MITVGQTNLWRIFVKRATMQAHQGGAQMSVIPAYNRWWNMQSQVLRATFIAKIEGEEYSRLKR